MRRRSGGKRVGRRERERKKERIEEGWISKRKGFRREGCRERKWNNEGRGQNTVGKI